MANTAVAYNQVMTLSHEQIILLVEAVGFLTGKDRNIVIENPELGVKIRRPEWNVWEILAISEAKIK